MIEAYLGQIYICWSVFVQLGYCVFTLCEVLQLKVVLYSIDMSIQLSAP